jgi:GAF domain-containing protein
MLTSDREQDERRLALVLATLNAVNSTSDMGRVTARVLDLAIELAEADRGVLLLTDDAGELTVELGRDAEQRDLPRDLDYSRTIVDQVAESGVAACIVDTLEVSDWKMGRSVSDLHLRAIMCSPLRIRDETTGVIYVDSKLARREFQEADVEVFEALCQQFAVTLENAWLNEAMLEGERETAAALLARRTRERLIVPLLELEQRIGALRPDPSGEVDAILSSVRHLQLELDGLEDWARTASRLPPPEPAEEPEDDDEREDDEPV